MTTKSGKKAKAASGKNPTVEMVRQHPDHQERVAIRVDGEAVRVEGDSDLLHRTVFNLVLNAVQHSPTDAEVHVEVGPVGEGELPPGVDFADGARLRVIDRGPGIEPAEMNRLFDPFFTTRPGGTGLGLALVHRAVEAHDGRVFVDGDSGRGTTFSVYFPTRLGQETA